MAFLINLFIFILAFIPRLYRLEAPLADWHSWRQADTAAVTRNFIKEGFNPFYPKFDSLYALNQYGDKNVNRYFFAEFPLYNILVYPFYRFFGVNLIWSRLVSIFFSAATAVVLFRLVSLYSSFEAGFLAGIFFALIPYNIYYGRVVMPDPLHVFLGVTSLYLISLWLKKDRFLWGILGGVALAGAILTKPYGLVLGLPVAVMIISRYQEKTLFYWKKIFLVALISLLPFILWRWHINRYPEGQFGTSWLINATNIRFRPAFFRWIVYERITKLILGGGGLVFLVGGLLAPKRKEEWLFYLSWLLGLVIFICYIATGNVTHDYYQLPLVPVLSALASLGVIFFLKTGRKILFRQFFNLTLCLGLIIMMLAVGWWEAKGFFNINNWAIVEAGREADRILPPQAKVIAPYNKDSAFLYQVNRVGWSFLPYPIEEMIKKGATHYVSVSFDETTQQLIKKCRVLKQTSNWVIIDLTHCDEKKN